jgi:aminopeptidase-like protein
MLKDTSCVCVSKDNVEPGAIGEEIYSLISKLYPICRSITGNGVRETLDIIQDYIPLEISEVPSGTKVFDWTIPKEWNIRDAYVKNTKGEKVIDFRKCNLHVVSYSLPVRRKMSLPELIGHLHSLPNHPDKIPYCTSYYKDDWGFCLTHNQLLGLEDGEYEVAIDSTLEDGSLTYGECFLPGSTGDEILISSHTCHPSLCNDNLSGVALATFLAKHILGAPRRYSYRFLFLPVTIGAIAWLCLNESKLSRIKHGLVLTLLGDSGNITYKKTRRGNAEIDEVMKHLLKHSGHDYRIVEFSPYGYDERQFCSQAFDLPVGCLMRTPYGQFPEYHNSGDDLDFIKPKFLGESFACASFSLSILENNRIYLNQNPKCEPQLGNRGLYESIQGQEASINQALFWVLNFSDGSHSLLDIAERSGMPFDLIKTAALVLEKHGLLKEMNS